MPEAVLCVAVITAALFIILRLQAKKPRGLAEIVRPHEHIVWLGGPPAACRRALNTSAA